MFTSNGVNVFKISFFHFFSFWTAVGRKDGSMAQKFSMDECYGGGEGTVPLEHVWLTEHNSCSIFAFSMNFSWRARSISSFSSFSLSQYGWRRSKSIFITPELKISFWSNSLNKIYIECPKNPIFEKNFFEKSWFQKSKFFQKNSFRGGGLKLNFLLKHTNLFHF
jgi:hypothetical protein